MREIKFRVWDDCTKQMVYIDFEDLCRHNQKPFEHTVNGIDASYPLDYDELWLHPVMQYTGLKDKNGKEIYEGDIVKVQHYVFGHESHKELHVVEFKDGMFGISMKSYLFEPLSKTRKGIKEEYIPNYGEIYTEFEDTVEVIGNTYENPDLLGGKE